jgi:hypothetical protein
MDVRESRSIGLPARNRWRLLTAGATLLGLLALGAGSATAYGPPGVHGGWFHRHPFGRPPARAQTCTGTPAAPGVLAGFYFGNVSIQGTCDVDGGAAVVIGELTVSPGSVLEASFAHNDQTGSGDSSLSVVGNIRVESGATAVLGCEPAHFPCSDDPTGTLSSQDYVFGALWEQQPLGVVMHDSVVLGSITETGGGGGLEKICEAAEASFGGNPVYSDYEDSLVGGDLNVIGLRSCWLGVARVHVGGSVNIINNELEDPDAIEILSNVIAHNLSCFHNSHPTPTAPYAYPVWDSGDEPPEFKLYPRMPEPNTVYGMRFGQCVHSSPTTEGEPEGTEPF